MNILEKLVVGYCSLKKVVKSSTHSYLYIIMHICMCISIECKKCPQRIFQILLYFVLKFFLNIFTNILF